MAGLRKFKCYRRLKRAYTRRSKFKKKGFIKAVPANKIVKFDMGNIKRKFKYSVSLVSRDNLQIRQNAIESSRLVISKKLVKLLGNNYFFKIRLYPHHVLRENKMLTGAGADRMQSGMQMSFGKAISIAAQVKNGQAVFSVNVNKEGINAAMTALKMAMPRLPNKWGIEVSENF